MGVFSEMHDVADELGKKVEFVVLSPAEAANMPAFHIPFSLYEKWIGLPGDVPAQEHITPAFVGVEMMPVMYFLDVVRSVPVDFRWTLFGSDHVKHYAVDATGRLMSEAAKRNKGAEISLSIAKLAYLSQRPVFFKTYFYEQQEICLSSNTVVLPLANHEDGFVSRLFGCSVWT